MEHGVDGEKSERGGVLEVVFDALAAPEPHTDIELLEAHGMRLEGVLYKFLRTRALLPHHKTEVVEVGKGYRTPRKGMGRFADEHDFIGFEWVIIK